MYELTMLQQMDQRVVPTRQIFPRLKMPTLKVSVLAYCVSGSL